MSTDRIKYLDNARGIAIFLVVLGHCIGAVDNPVNKVILSFHMPLFFIISGILLNDKVIEASSIKHWIIKKCKHLLLPQLTLGLFECVFILFHFFYENHAFTSLSVNDVVHAILKWWFLLVMFQVSMISLLLKNFILKKRIRVVLFVAFLVLIISLQRFGLIFQENTFLFVNILPFAMLFYMIGYLAKNIFANAKKFLIPVAILVVIIISLMNETVLIYQNQYGIFLFFMLTSLLGSYAVIGIAQMVNFFFLEWLGKVCIIIYVLQFHLNQYCSPVVTFLLGKILSSNINGDVYSCLYICLRTFFSFSLCVLLAYFISRCRYVRSAFGYESAK